MNKLKEYLPKLFSAKGVAIIAIVFSILATWYAYEHDIIVVYGDAESHLNIAKRVVDSLTPGFAQLGGIWLPLPHILLLPFVKFDFLWRSGLAGSIVSGLAFTISAVYIYKLALLLTNKRGAGFVAALLFMLNPNVLYLQSTPMTELTLIAFFILSSYYFIRFIQNQTKYTDLILAAVFGFGATLSRYDGWFLVLAEAVVLVILLFPWKWSKERFVKLEGLLVLFSTLAFFGIILWLAWGWLILGDPLYFTHSQFSAKSQQSNWLAQGLLPTYKRLDTSFLYYLFTSVKNIGPVIFGISLIGFLLYVFYKPSKQKLLIAAILNVVFIFYVATLYIGQSVIFIRPLTPDFFPYTLFNVRYGVMMVPVAAIFFAYLFSRSNLILRVLLILIIFIQTGFYLTKKAEVISMLDGTSGLSSARRPDAEQWLRNNYDDGLILLDDYARTVSVIRAGIPMQNVIYIGNKPYWEESLTEPEKYARWVIVQKDDSVWRSLIDDPQTEARLYKYFQKAYTSPNILIFRRNDLAIN